MAFDALEVAIQLCAALQDPIERIRQRDPDLADQARRACNGVPLQLSEARRRTGKDRLNRYRMAAGSATTSAWFFDRIMRIGARTRCSYKI